MSGLLDTNVVVRYLTGDPIHLARKAARIIDEGTDLTMTDVALAEVAYVLASYYRMDWHSVVDCLMTFLQKENIEPAGQDKNTVLQALLLCRPSKRVSIADALIWAAAQSTKHKIVYSLDARFPAANITVLDDLPATS